MRSSSYLKINGDKKLSKFNILVYVVLNLFQNIFYNFSIRKFRYINFKNNVELESFDKTHSISRNLCTLFWKKFNWHELFKVMGSFLIHEIGVGDGSYSKNKIQIPKKFIKNYFGYDIKLNSRWIFSKSKKISYATYDGQSFSKIFNKKQNIFISQSCLEHVKFDLQYFIDLKKSLKSNEKKALFIHCVPSPFCIFTYLSHGFRQFNCKNINSISNIYGKNNIYVCRLGNFGLNLDHLKKTTVPLIFTKKNSLPIQKKSYYNYIKSKFNSNKNGNLFFANFLVIVGFVNFLESEKNNIFKENFDIVL
jgi:hypothetical protein